MRSRFGGCSFASYLRARLPVGNLARRQESGGGDADPKIQGYVEDLEGNSRCNHVPDFFLFSYLFC